MRQVGGVIVLLAGIVPPALAQERMRAEADVLLYGDDTEFRNPFREGETIFGSAGRACVVVDLTDRVAVRGGAFLRHRFGGDEAFDLARPLLSLTVRGRSSTVVIGTLPPPTRYTPVGNRETLHGLLPPLQRETLLFERSYENGLLWTVNSDQLRHAAWLNWQRLNTPEHRERFDAGVVSEFLLSDHLSLPAQAHIVHEGGQQFAAGAVSDSYAGAAGLAWRGRAGRLGTGRLEFHALASRHVPDREAPERSRTGRAFLAHASSHIGAWRGHILFWRARHFVKTEGDPNYLSLRRDGRYYGGTRDYAEAGLTREWTPAGEVRLQASARLHRTERHYEYSFRILATAGMDWRW